MLRAVTNLYDFDSINVASVNERDPDADGATGMSASKMRESTQKIKTLIHLRKVFTIQLLLTQKTHKIYLKM